ncbi:MULTISPECIES: aminodeoxychorismate synthase component I [Streptomycetaceae]|uniref:Aminodeoxychorismate synthase n=1 Tax=Streptantibioticus cattleyicolor (strain ATCC 35852 / DSM 46488 / JCM 4925 / NBRC 14057 / NRRL 8057) TaxID=1003195 RepID=F8K480_STREN|nr:MULTISPECIES: aminodeoxychorismate synthase component I [Streptomycetaceae]AEW93835.1 para-aminobenzoate synthase [Streptantibioticus cattleyicolor NRRL 8057 = DSM 46488]MYS58519.1 aminodeoxychorismate synthase component I [Streptomyces sp. SID5468]CCB74182.1 Para-aminobenzoate synthase [Streptantibioticus cattleyicolor NRRL 8057 = DSM 46488]
MRTLLIDNYDSFTYNLVHQIAAATGQEPEVVRNDDPGWRAGRLDGYDAVVISPGPGTPRRTSDFGICDEVIARCERARLPLLGICLGHQGIAARHGGTVERAPEPRHGRTSPVLHDGTGLFAGVPSPFEVVRYHSLAVTDLPDELRATAWTEDGVLMALAHRERPVWGLQFHPESICTRHGDLLLRNFTALARAERAAHPRPPVTVRAPEPTPAPAAPPRELEVLAERIPTRWDAEVVFDRLFRERPYAYWLDGGGPGSGLSADGTGRFSVLGDATGPLARVATADVWTGTVTVRERGREQLVTGSFLDWLDADLRGLRTTCPELPCDFALGWVGYLGYELKAECGGERAHRSPDPDAVLVFTDRAIVLDHATGTTYLLALAERGARSQARAWLRETRRRLAALAGAAPGPAPRPQPAAHGIRLRHDRARYLELIAEAQEEIAAGETYEVCLTNTADIPGPVDAWQAYRLLRRLSPAPFGALLSFGGLSVLSTSPERFLRIGADGVAESRPIKGTRPRGATAAEDEALRAGLAADEKDRSENLMIVDLVRNDLGRCAVTGSVVADDVFRVESFRTVHQLVSTVRARLRPGASAVDCVRSAFPGGSMTGAPKVRTMRIIDRLEGGPRGVYSGVIGYFSLTGAADLSIVIRTAVVTERGIRYGTGGAIVALSDPAAEFEETAVKAAPLLALTATEFPGRADAGAPGAGQGTDPAVSRS